MNHESKTESKTENKILPPEEERFHANLIQLLETISKLAAYAQSQGHNIVDPKFVLLGVEVARNLNKHAVINDLTLKSLPYWKEIHKKNQEFFIQNAHTVFSLWPGSSVDPFKILFTAKKKDSSEDLISTGSTDMIWLTLHLMVKIMIKYAHKHGTVDKTILKEQIELWQIKF